MRLIGLWNSRGIEGTSGGDVCFQELWKRFNCDKVLVTTEENKQPICFSATYIKRTLKNIQLPEGDVVYSSSDFFPDVIPAFYSDKPWVQKIYHIIPRKGVSQIAQQFSFSLIKQRADLIIVCSNLLKQQLEDLGFQNRIEVVYPGVIHKSCTLSTSPTYDCVFLGRLCKAKGVDYLEKIWKKVIEKKQDAKLAIIGQGKSFSFKGLTNFGYVTEDTKYDVIHTSKIYISTSKEEGFNLSMAEAVKCGLKAIAWHLPVYDEIFGDSIIKVPCYDINKFAQTILAVLKNYNSIYMSNDIIKRYDWDKSAKQEMELIWSLKR